MTSGDEHGFNSRRLLEQAQGALREGDLLQASQKAWGAAAHALKAVAEDRGWEHHSHKLLFRVVTRLAAETADRELRDLFLVANSLHTNFYEDWMTEELVRHGLDRVGDLVRKLEHSV